jgi:glutamate formiminotransferase
VAFNVWLADGDIDAARRLAAAVRGEHVQALGLAVGTNVQVSMNLIAPAEVGPAQAYDVVASSGAAIERSELVGLLPRAVLEAIPRNRWAQLDLSEERTIEGRLAARRADAGPG